MKLASGAGVGLFGLLAAGPGLAAQTPRPSWPEVDAVFQAFSKPGSPGCSVAMAVRDSVIYRRGYGLAVIEWGIPNDPQSRGLISGRGVAVVTTCNDATADPTSLALDAAAVVLKDRLQPDAAVTAHRGTALGPFAGIYWSEAAAQALFMRWTKRNSW